MRTGGSPQLNHRKLLYRGKMLRLAPHFSFSTGKNISIDSMFFLHKILRSTPHFAPGKVCILSDRFRAFLRSTLITAYRSVKSLRSSPRPISIAQLRTLLHFHLRPINPVVFMGSYSFRMGDLILKSASRLDAFSVYPIRTWLPSCAVGTTTDTPLVRPSRSSRTEDSSSQISCAHDG